MKLSYSIPYNKSIQTLSFNKDPFIYGLGLYTDVHGIVWDIICLIGGKHPYVNARTADHHVLHSTCSEYCAQYSCTWEPYYVQVIESH